MDSFHSLHLIQAQIKISPFFDEIMEKAPEEARKIKEYIKKVQKREAGKKRTIRKNTNNPK